MSFWSKPDAAPPIVLGEMKRDDLPAKPAVDRLDLVLCQTCGNAVARAWAVKIQYPTGFQFYCYVHGPKYRSVRGVEGQWHFYKEFETDDAGIPLGYKAGSGR